MAVGRNTTLAQPSIFGIHHRRDTPARASAPRASLPSGPLSPASLMDVGYSDIYNLDTGGAHKAFQVWERSHSGDPLGPTSEAAADLFWESTRCMCCSPTFSWTTTSFSIANGLSRADNYDRRSSAESEFDLRAWYKDTGLSAVAGG